MLAKRYISTSLTKLHHYNPVPHLTHLQQQQSYHTRPSSYLLLFYIAGCMTLPFAFTAYKTPFNNNQQLKGILLNDHYFQYPNQKQWEFPMYSGISENPQTWRMPLILLKSCLDKMLIRTSLVSKAMFKCEFSNLIWRVPNVQMLAIQRQKLLMFNFEIITMLFNIPNLFFSTSFELLRVFFGAFPFREMLIGFSLCLLLVALFYFNTIFQVRHLMCQF